MRPNCLEISAIARSTSSARPTSPVTTSTSAPDLSLEPLGRHLGLLGVSSQDDDLGPRLGQALGDAQTDPAVAPRHDRHFAGKVEQCSLRSPHLAPDC